VNSWSQAAVPALGCRRCHVNSWSQAEVGCGVQCTIQAAAGRGSDQVGRDELVVTGGSGSSFSSAPMSFLVAHGIAVSSWSQQYRSEIW
jgi:hypothetical protein